MSGELKPLGKSVREHLYQWRKCNIETEQTLENLAIILDQKFKNISIAKTAGATTSIVGGILSAIGFGLSFVTFGASLGLAIAGGVIAGVGGTTVGGSMIADAVLSKQNRESAQAVLDKYNKSLKTIKEDCIQISEKLKQKDESMEKFQHWVSFWWNLFVGIGSASWGMSFRVTANTVLNSLRISASFADDAVSTGVKAGATAFKALGTAGKGFHIFGGVMGIVLMPLDIYTLVDSAIAIHKNEEHAVSKKIRDIAAKIGSSRPKPEEIESMITDTFQ